MQILIVKTSSLGDIIQALPVLSLLRKSCPGAQVDWVVEAPFKELLDAHEGIDQVIPVAVRDWKKKPFECRQDMRAAYHKLREKPYDLLIDLQGNIKSACITWCTKAHQKIGTTFSSAPEWPNALVLNRRYPLNKKEPMSLQYLSLVQKHFALSPEPLSPICRFSITEEEKGWITSQLFPGVRYMVSPGSRWENKKLSLPTWIEILKEVSQKEDPHYYFVWGNSREEEEAHVLHAQFPQKSTLLPRLSLPLWQNFMTHMDALFTVDSSALHLAATAGIPTYSFFGPSSSAIYNPSGSQHHAFQRRCPYGKTFTKRCPALRTCKTGACLKEDTSTLLSSIKDLL